MSNKRIPVKWIRDRAKAAYEKKAECFICGSTESLDLHHFNGVTNLFEKWIKVKGYKIESDDDIIKYRDEFIDEHRVELYDEVVTLCHPHHLKLHSIYGKSPALATAKKQASWVQKQRDKHYGMDT